MRELLTPKQVARAIGVSEASLKRWCDKGLIPATRTAGGHRRLPLAGVMEYLRRSNRDVIRPEVLGLPSTSGMSDKTLDRAAVRLAESLLEGDEHRVRATLIDLYLASHTIEAISDKVIAPAFRELGERWESGECEVYQERRACEITLRALYYLGAALPPPAENAPVALGATINPDWYSIALTTGELLLRSLGWNALSLGPCVPPSSIGAALRSIRPRLLWLSVSYVADEDEFVEAYEQLFAVAAEERTAVAIGGRALTASLRQRIRFSAHCDNFSHLVSFVETLHRSKSEGNGASAQPTAAG